MSCLIPPPWELGNFTTLKRLEDPVYVWRKFVDGVIIQDSLRDTIEREIESSYHWQGQFFSLDYLTAVLLFLSALAYKYPPKVPSIHDLPIAWEQSLVAGHPTHPVSAIQKR
jgi:hypothetical protein